VKQSVPKTLQAVADLIGTRLQGDPNCLISGIATLENAKKGDISFLSKPQYRKYLSSTKASAVILSSEDVKNCPINALISDNPRLSLAKVVALFEEAEKPSQSIHATAIIGENCKIHASVTIEPYCVIGDNVTLEENVVIGSHSAIGNKCRVDANTILKSRVTLYGNIRVGRYCLIHSGVVIGSDGFGFANQSGAWIKVPHLGGVTIGDQVEIGANTTIDRGFLEDTTLEDNVIIDNLVQIGHNVTIGAGTAIAGCVAIAGSTKIGAACLIGGGSCIGGHLQITDHVHITATSAVNHSLNEKGVYSSGFPAKPSHLWRKNVARFQFLNDMAKRLRALEQKIYSHAHLTENE
jgi:UDP-3-O-[3-hydroxymyristoyl] glucosamine N-acyltransferase